MKKLNLLAAFMLLTITTTFSQAFNTVLRDRVTYESSLNDIWGYVAPDSTEYALVGKRDGVSIVSLADPDNAVEVASIPGDQSTWRDLKTFGEYAYVVADQGDEGLTIIDLTDLPNNVTWTHNNLQVPNAGTLNRAHNIYVDPADGIAYISGANINGGGMILYDIATNPGGAEFVALAPNIYSHDVYVQDGRMYASEINIGRLRIYDVSDPQNITPIGDRETPFAFTHNAWTTADANYVFTTDERGNAPIGCYDISDASNPVLIDEFRPTRSVGSGVVPHNVHVLDEYLSISYYTDGLEIADASVPDNVIEVAYYDTWEGGDGGFNGAWGAYPFLPSGLTLVTDISNGLYIVDINYKRAARLKGLVTDADLGTPLNNVTVTLSSPEDANTATDAAGDYATGVADAGNFVATFSKDGFVTQNIPVDMVNGEELVLNVEMESQFARFNVAGNVVSSEDASPIDGAEVVFIGNLATYTGTADANGVVNLDNVFEGTYEVFAAKWGFRNRKIDDIVVGQGEEVLLELDPGYLDGFVLDQGWETTGNASTGLWDRAIPFGTFFGNTPANPGFDAGGFTDLGEFAYVSGNLETNNAGADDIDGGDIILTSPVFDPTIFMNAELNYQYWFFNDGGDPPLNDELKVELTNGSETVTLATYTETTLGC